jgi:hypothetical protein
VKSKLKPQLAVSPQGSDYPSLSVATPPISVRADDAARILGTTTFFIEEMMRSGELPFVVFGKRRVVFVADLVAWAQRERSKQHAQQRIGVAA